MILSEIQKLKNSTITNKQLIIVKCDVCKKEWTSTFLNQESGYKKYKKDLCRGCKQKEQIKLGIRGKQYVNAGIGAKKSLKGKTYEEIFGLKKANELKEKLSKKLSGENNPNFGGTWHGEHIKGTWDSRYGLEKSLKLKKQRSFYSSGKNNPMYGKPSPQGSGNGWSGWYNGWFFRSLKELSYMIFVIERFNLSWKTAETKEYKIEYVDWNEHLRTYHPDFLIEGKYLVEIKPKTLWNSDIVKRKKEAAIEFCNIKKFKYKLTESVKLITNNELKELIKQEKLFFTKRYQEKFNNLII